MISPGSSQTVTSYYMLPNAGKKYCVLHIDMSVHPSRTLKNMWIIFTLRVIYKEYFVRLLSKANYFMVIYQSPPIMLFWKDILESYYLPPPNFEIF